MNVNVEIRNILSQLSPFLAPWEVDLTSEFISHEGVGLALEFLCDVISERVGVFVPEKTAKKIQEMTDYLQLDPIKTWIAIPIEEESTHAHKRLFAQGIDPAPEARAVIEACKDKLPDGALECIYDLFDHGEGSVGFETFCDCLILEKQPIGREIFNRINRVMAIGNIDQERYRGFIVQDENKGEERRCLNI